LRRAHSLRERQAGWYSSGVYLAHKMLEEVGVAALMTLAFSCILYFPMQLHGTWALFWMVYFLTSTIGVGELLQSHCCTALLALHLATHGSAWVKQPD
jgi:ABC-type multidrug transport system permease subunit